MTRDPARRRARWIPVAAAVAALALIGADAPAPTPGAGTGGATGGLVSVESLVAFLTLTALEIVLGIDNIIFIAILAGTLPEDQRDRARKLGLAVAVISRVALLLAIGLVMRLKSTAVVNVLGLAITGKDLVLIVGGLFLIAKATYEIHHRIEAAGGPDEPAHARAGTLRSVLLQVLAIDVVFSLDSVITAVGMTPHVPVMIAAILASVGIMLAFSGPIVRFVDRHPTIKILALAFLILIGTLLVAEGFHQEIDKGYVYFAMAFAAAVDLIQMKAVPARPAA